MRPMPLLLLAACANSPVQDDAGGRFRVGTTAAADVGTAAEDQYATVAWGDADGDGDDDLAVGLGALWGAFEDQVYRNDGGSLVLSWTSPAATPTSAVAWVDVDADGDLDLSTAADDQGGAADNRVYQNVGGGALTPWYDVEGEGCTDAIAWGDLDADGLPDPVVARAGWYDAYGGGPFDPGTSAYVNTGVGVVAGWDTPKDRAATGVDLADVDADGDLDLAEATLGTGTRVFLNDGAGAFVPSWSDGRQDDATDVAFGDFNADGLPDLVVTTGARSRVWANLGGGAFALAWTSPQATTLAAAWGDVDGDGDLDLVFANDGPNEIFANTGAGFTRVWTSEEDDRSIDVALGDWDGDGDLDLAFGNDYGAVPVRIYANGSVAFRYLQPPPTTIGAEVEVRVHGMTPGANVSLFEGTGPGLTAAPGCAGVDLGIAGAAQVGPTIVADADGAATIPVTVPESHGGTTTWLQALDASACDVTGVVEQRWDAWLRVGSAEVRVVDEVEGIAGISVAMAGDHDGDGLSDLLIGSPSSARGNRSYAGKVYVASVGPGEQALADVAIGTLYGETWSNFAGGAVAGGQDMDGDGFADVLVGAASNGAGGTNAGAAYLVHGPVVGKRDLGTADLVVRGDDPSDALGAALQLGGDLTGDGVPDLALGATRGQVGGAVYLVSGGAVGVMDAGAAASRVESPLVGDELGKALAVDDVDGDGVDDLFVGAPGVGVDGAAYLFLGPIVGVRDVATADVAITDVPALTEVGFAVALGDQDADGVGDLVVAHHTDGATSDGGVLVFSGTLTGVLSAADAHVAVEGEPSARVGQGLAVGDLDGDLLGDLMVGAPFAGIDQPYGAYGYGVVGAVGVLLGPATGTYALDTLDELWAGDEATRTGHAVGFVEDRDGDAVNEVLAGGSGDVVLFELD